MKNLKNIRLENPENRKQEEENSQKYTVVPMDENGMEL